jgi:probable rRNA maturation factor
MTRLAVDVGTVGVRVSLGRDRVRALAQRVLRAEGARDALLSITFVTPRAIAALNQRHLGHNRPTDVIAFGWTAPAGPRQVALGDVYIAPDVARENARAHGSGIREELARLVVHGTLHVLGHDHPDGDARVTSTMWKRQEALLARARAAGAW